MGEFACYPSLCLVTLRAYVAVLLGQGESEARYEMHVQ